MLAPRDRGKAWRPGVAVSFLSWLLLPLPMAYTNVLFAFCLSMQLRPCCSRLGTSHEPCLSLYSNISTGPAHKPVSSWVLHLEHHV